MGDDRWRAILEQLEVNVSRRVAGLCGQKVKHTGDGYLLTFAGPTPAIECAKALARDTKALGLELRTGIHMGECERRGDDLSGLAVHLAARIMAEALPGSILASRTVKDLTVGSGLNFTFVGCREMKGIPESWEIYEWRADGPVMVLHARFISSSNSFFPQVSPAADVRVVQTRKGRFEASRCDSKGLIF